MLIHMHFRLAVLSLVGFSFAEPTVSSTKCAGKTFSYLELAGYGFVPGDARDRFGDTLSLGSSIAMKRGSWKKQRNGEYKGRLYALPDRGWNTNGTLAYQTRLHVLDITLNPDSKGLSKTNLKVYYQDTILFTDPTGNPIVGLDANTTLAFPGFPEVPAVTYDGNGFGQPGPGGTRMSLDPEGLVLDEHDSSFWISDEYGPYIYHFSASGKLLSATQPPSAFLPLRNGKINFASNNPPIYNPDQKPKPKDPDSGRSNNQGLECLTYDENEKALYSMLQSATIQDGGLEKTTNRYSRLLKYSLRGKKPKLEGEWVVPLPQYVDPTKNSNPRTAAASEILSLGHGRFFALSRDSGFGAGLGANFTSSVYRKVDVFSISSATNILNKYDEATGAVSPGGVLRPDIKPAEYCEFLDYNVNGELKRFGLRNGGDDNPAKVLNEKWEGLDLVQVEGGKKGEYWLLTTSDNDFITQNGYQNFGKFRYKDGSGANLNNQILLFRISIK